MEFGEIFLMLILIMVFTVIVPNAGIILLLIIRFGFKDKQLAKSIFSLSLLLSLLPVYIPLGNVFMK